MDNKNELQPVEETQLIVGKDSVKKATKIANELAKLINAQKLYAVIQNRKFVTVEGWNTLGAMMGVFPEVVRTERIPDGDNITFLAEVRLKTPDGRVISTAQSICSSTERNMQGKDLYVIFSMAQTRATGKAFRLAFSWIIKMAGFEPGVAEEIPQEGFKKTYPPRTDEQKRNMDVKEIQLDAAATDAQGEDAVEYIEQPPDA